MRRMQRSAGVTVIATFALLGSLFLLACSGLIVLGMAIQGNAVNVPNAKLGLVFVIVLFLIPAIWGTTTSIALYRVKRWARISTLIFAGLLSFVGVTSPLFLLAIPLPTTPGADPSIIAGVKIGMTGVYLMLAAIGIWWLVYFTRPAVKAQFNQGAVPRPPSARPLSISIIGWFFVITGMFIPINLALRFPTVVFGMVITGWASALYLLVFGGVQLVAGYGLLRLKPFAWWLALGYFVVIIVNAAVSNLLPGSAERMQRLMDALPASLHTPGPMPFDPFRFTLYFIPLWFVPLYFVWRNRKAFEPGLLPPAVPPPPPLASEPSI
jgi:hypothetical protein